VSAKVVSATFDRATLRRETTRWLRAMILVGAIYLVASLGFGALAGAAGSHQMRVAWRLAAWATSAVAFGAHIWYEHFTLRSSTRRTALHVAMSAALGAFGLALAANVHARAANTGSPRALAIALVAWPVLVGLPAFLVALTAAAGLTVVRRRRERRIVA
jgi:hypothetical protein